MKTRIAWILASLLLLVPACRGPEKAPPPGELKAVFEDVPAPEGLAYEEGYGHRAPSGGLRTYFQKYVGPRGLANVRKFYEEALPVHGWKLVSTEGQDPLRLVFEKKIEACLVELSNVGPNLQVTIKIEAKK